MRNKNGEKRIQAERPRVQGNPPALDRDRHRLILGYARLPLAQPSRVESRHRTDRHASSTSKEIDVNVGRDRRREARLLQENRVLKEQLRAALEIGRELAELTIR